MMHEWDKAAALGERAARLAPCGTLLLQYHLLNMIVRDGQWNALRHAHYAYYSTTALAGMLAAAGFRARTAWEFGPYGGTVFLAARRAAEAVAGSVIPASCADCSATWRPRRPACTTGSRPSMPSATVSSGTGLRPAPWRCCARPRWVSTCCLPWPTPRRPSTGCGYRNVLPRHTLRRTCRAAAGRRAAVRPRPAGGGPRGVPQVEESGGRWGVADNLTAA